MSKFKCIIFDCDGVLVDSEPISNRVIVEMAQELGANIDMEYALRHFKGNALRNCITQISTLIDKEIPKDFEFQYRLRSYAAFKNEIKPIPNISEVLNRIELPFCVASSGPEEKIRLNLEATGLLPYFEGKIYSCHAINKWKPEPDVFLWASKSMGFSPEECLVIEDSQLGITAAKKGGFTVYAYSPKINDDELLLTADKTFDSMLKLPELLVSKR
ncbi:MAG: HAD family hydrolase [Winogradskyella sp.]|nr:HAD family hydrolase [Winogradskyella sp.]